MANSRDGNRPRPASLAWRMRSSTRACGRWRASRNASCPVPVGGKRLVAPAVTLFEQRQLGSGVPRASIAQLAKAEAAWAAATEAAKSERIQLKRRIPRSDAETSAMAALLAADQLPAPPTLRKALHTIDIHLTETIDQARLLPKTA